ncbi:MULTISPECIES: hypothetical protein [Polymorphospora]|uniref:Uncharacterized protein n=1 Tax=Polymorphospora lycopeni TaxID=3140240 RepID=A0ABV5CJD1_9ACTN
METRPSADQSPTGPERPGTRTPTGRRPASGQRPGRSRRTAAGWIGGAVVAALAVIAVNSASQALGQFHWWAGFVLVPGALIAATGGPLVVRGGNRAFAGYVIACVGGLVFAVGALLMFGVMSRGWPLMVVLPCLAVAGTYGWQLEHPLARGLHRVVAMLASTGAAVGITLQLIVLDWVELTGVHWWGGFMMLAAVIVFFNALELVRHRMQYRLQAIALLVGPAVVTFLLGLRFVRGW